MNTYEHGKGECTFSFNFSNNPPMKKYEYKTLFYEAKVDNERIDAFIEPWAHAGWRIVSSVSCNRGYGFLIFLEREIQS